MGRLGRELDHVPGPPGRWWFGNATQLARDPLTVISNIALQYGGEEGVCRYHFFKQPILLVSNPTWIKYVLSDASDNFEKERDPYLASIVGNGLLVSQGAFWSRQRRLMMPAFSSSMLKRSFEVIVAISEKALAHWSALPQIDVRTEMTKFTLEVISQAAFSHQLNLLSDAGNRLSQAITDVFDETEKRVFQHLPWHLLPFSRGAKRFREGMECQHSTLMEVIRRKKALLLHERDAAENEDSDDGDDTTTATTKTKKEWDVLDRLIRATDEETGERLSDQQLLDEAMAILLAGHETTANTIAFVFFMLATYPEEEAKVVREIEEKLPGGMRPTLAAINDLERLDLFVKETMRLFPAAAQLADRVTRTATTIARYPIPAGAYVEIWPYQLHRDPTLWKDPETFCPDRFREGPAHRFAYLPFSLGTRSCIGEKLAMLEIKVITVMTLQRYRPRMTIGHQTRPVLTVTLRAEDAIMTLDPPSRA